MFLFIGKGCVIYCISFIFRLLFIVFILFWFSQYFMVSINIFLRCSRFLRHNGSGSSVFSCNWKSIIRIYPISEFSQQVIKRLRFSVILQSANETSRDTTQVNYRQSRRRWEYKKANIFFVGDLSECCTQFAKGWRFTPTYSFLNSRVITQEAAIIIKNSFSTVCSSGC